MNKLSKKLKAITLTIPLVICSITTARTSANENPSNWQSIIRAIPYSYSQGFHQNLSTIRQWVLLQQGFCEKVERHILFDSRGQFLGYIENQQSKQLTQDKLNQTRQSLHKKGRVNRWIEGNQNNIGYPFALNCDQPHVDVTQAIDRLIGKSSEDRIWGTWDGMSVGNQDSPIPLYQLVKQVYQTKSEIIGRKVVAAEFRYFLAQIIIESGARKKSLSKANAIGLLQLKPNVLKDCQIPEKFYQHRMAQVDCAVRLFQQNQRNLTPVFEQAFKDFPEDKKHVIQSMLMVQSYHSGVGRISRLFSDKVLNKTVKYFVDNQQLYSAEDIAVGLIYHNMGRTEFGFASLYYVIDVAIVADKLCQQKALKESWFCL